MIWVDARVGIIEATGSCEVVVAVGTELEVSVALRPDLIETASFVLKVD